MARKRYTEEQIIAVHYSPYSTRVVIDDWH